jgi:hypothetical protein
MSKTQGPFSHYLFDPEHIDDARSVDEMARLPTFLQNMGLILALGVLLVLPPCGTGYQVAVADEWVTVVESRASYSFAQQITFTLQASSEAEVTQVYLFFQATGDERVESVNMAVESSHNIDVNHIHELRNYPLPPFATVTFWWQINTADGDSLTTEPQQFQYMDNRFRWEQLSADDITVHWIEGQGDPAFGQAALDIARTSAEEINAELHAPKPSAMDIYIYDSQDNLSSAMALTGREWVSGQAHPELGVAVVAILFTEGYTSRMMRYIPHEITHLLVYRAVSPSAYRYVPEWLDEGLATANERLPTPEYVTALEEASAEEQLLPVEELCVPFSPNSRTALLAYAQSGSLVRFIRERYGAQGIRSLLETYANGASCAGGVQKALDISFSGLETAWRASLEPHAPWRAWVKQIGIWVGLWLLSLLVAVPMLGGLRRR